MTLYFYLFHHLKSRTVQNIFSKTCWSVRTGSFHWVLLASKKFLGEEVQRRLSMLHGLFTTSLIVLNTESSGMNLTNAGFHPTFSLENPTSNCSLCIQRQKKIQKEKAATSRPTLLVSNFSFASGKMCSSCASTTWQSVV